MQKAFVFIIILFTFTIVSGTSGPSGSISGFVYDKKSGEGLVGANVFIKDTYIGSATNTSGYYSLPRVPVGEYTIMCQFIGYGVHTQQVKVTAKSNIELNINLKPTTIETEEIAVVADSVRTSVKLYRKPISKIKLNPRDIERAPQVVESDLLRSLHTMPGIATVSDFSSELYVRGGTPDQNLYLIDGTDVYNPEHLFGLFSTFNTDAIKNVEISKGGFGAEYGGRLSSVLDVTNLDGNRREYKSNTSVSLLSAKTTMQVPIGKIGSLSGSVRRTYFDKTIAKMDALKDENIPDYYFYDGHIKAYFDLAQSDKLTISAYKGYDDMNFNFDKDNPDSESMFYDWGNTTISARWTHIFSPMLFGNFWVTSSSFDSFWKFEDMDEENDMDDRTVKGNLEYFYSQKLNVKTGFEYKSLRSVYNTKFPGGEVDIDQKPQHFAAYVQSEWRPSPLMELQTGLRFNSCKNRGKTWWDLDPRISAKYRLTDKMSIKGAYGRFHQYLFRVPRAFIADIWGSSDEYYDDAKSAHYILGLQREVSRDFALEVEGYYKSYRNLYYYDPFFYTELDVKQYNSKGEPLYLDTENIWDLGDAYSYGLEFLLRKDTGAMTGWLAYTLGRTMYQVDGLNQDEYFPPRHDRTSTFNLVGNIDVKNTLRKIKGKPFVDDKKKWRIGLNFTYASGQPITLPASFSVTRNAPDQDFIHAPDLVPAERNSYRLPPYIRLDFSVTYSRQFRGWKLEPFLQVYNATNRRNVWFISYEQTYETDRINQEIDATGMLPILPSVGVNIIF